MLDKKIRRYYRQILFGNRNPLARLLDFVALRAIVFVAFLLWFSLQTSHVALSFILSGVATGMVSVALALYKNIRLDRFAQVKRRELSRIFMLEQMVLMSRHAFIKLAASMAHKDGYLVERLHPRGVLCRDENNDSCILFALQNHPSDPISAQQLLECYRYVRQNAFGKGILLCTATLSDNATTLLGKLPAQRIGIWDQYKLLSLAEALDMLPNPEDVEKGILEELEQRRMHLKQLKKQAFAVSRVRSYIVCGLVLFFASIVTGQHLYYPLMGAACFFMAFLSYFLDGNRQRSVSG